MDHRDPATARAWDPSYWEDKGYLRHWCDASVGSPWFEVLANFGLNTFLIRVQVNPAYLMNPAGTNGAGTAGWCGGSDFFDLGGGESSLLCEHPTDGGVSGTDLEFALFSYDYAGKVPTCDDITIVQDDFIDVSLNTLDPVVACQATLL